MLRILILLKLEDIEIISVYTWIDSINIKLNECFEEFDYKLYLKKLRYYYFECIYFILTPTFNENQMQNISVISNTSIMIYIYSIPFLLFYLTCNLIIKLLDMGVTKTPNTCLPTGRNLRFMSEEVFFSLIFYIFAPAQCTRLSAQYIKIWKK